MGIHTRMLTATLAIAVLGAPAVTGLPAAGAGSSARAASISVKVSEPVLLVGQQAVIRGKVRPAKPRTRVMLQQRVTGGWKNLARRTTSQRGRYRFAVEPGAGGVFRYRVIKLPWLRTGTVHSPTVSVTAYRWIDVNTIIDLHEGVASFQDPATIDGATYPRSIVIDADSQGDFQGGFFEVDLDGRLCAAFDATVGALDDNAEGSEVGIEVLADADPIAEGSYAQGDSERLTLDVRGADRLRVEGVVVMEGPQGELGVGTPRLLCAS